MANPSHVNATARPTDRAITSGGRTVSRSAIAGGVTSSEKISSTPTTWTASETAIASTTMNAMLRKRTGTPRAAATSSSSEANSSGRYSPTTAASVTTPATSVTTTATLLIPRISPKRIAYASVAYPLYRFRNRTPSPSVQASTMPITTSRPRMRLPSTPITTPAPTVNTSSPTIEPTANAAAPPPKKAATTATPPAAPANPMCDGAWPAKASERSTTKYPTTPATTATTVPAMNALRMKSYRNSSAMSEAMFQVSCVPGAVAIMSLLVRVRCLLIQAHHEDVAVTVAQHLDLGAVDG